MNAIKVLEIVISLVALMVSFALLSLALKASRQRQRPAERNGGSTHIKTQIRIEKEIRIEEKIIEAWPGWVKQVEEQLHKAERTDISAEEVVANAEKAVRDEFPSTTDAHLQAVEDQLKPQTSMALQPKTGLIHRLIEKLRFLGR